MKTTIHIVIAILLLAGTAFTQTPVVGDVVYPTTHLVAEDATGKSVNKGPGSAGTVAELWPLFVVVRFDDGTTAQVERANLSAIPLTPEEIQTAIATRLSKLPELIADKQLAIAELEKKISKKTAAGTIRRKVTERDSLGGGGTSIKYAASKEETALEALRLELKSLTAEKAQLAQLSARR
jgi:hypothetical protein